MAITVGTVTTGIADASYGSGVYGLTTHTTASDTTLLILVMAHIKSGTQAVTASWNDVTMTPFVIDRNNEEITTGIYALKNPAIGNYVGKIHGTSAAGANSPWIGLINLKGARSTVGGTLNHETGYTLTVQGNGGLIIDVAYGDTEATPNQPTGTGVGTKVDLWNNQTISVADKTGSMYVTCGSSDITTSYTGDIISYAAAQVVEGSDSIPQAIFM